MSDKIGLPETLSLAVGGMVGGGIFAVLGVVAAGAGTAAWVAFTIAGGIALCAGYSFIRLNSLCTGLRSPIGQIEEISGERRLAGMMGWLLTFGYVGTMAMYAFAFGSYLQELVGFEQLWAIPVRPLFSVGSVVLFGGLNLLGARASGKSEDALVASKVAILVLFAGGGLYYGVSHGTVASGIDAISVGALTAAAIAFVAFEGWELLMFDQDSIKNPRETVRKAIYISIVGTTLLYVLVAIVTTNLVSLSTLRANPETALAIAAKPFFGQFGFTLIAVAAVISTGSALNATLFSASRLSAQISRATARGTETDEPSATPDGGNELSAYCEATPTHRSLGDDTDSSSESGPPTRTVIVLGTLTAIFTFYGSLDGITSFASGAFMTIFGTVSGLAFMQRSDALRTAVIPALGAVGSGVALIALLWNLHRTNPDVLVTTAVIWAVVLSVYWVPKR